MNKITQLSVFYNIKSLLVFLIFWAIIFWQTLSSMVSIWLASDSYTHAFLILPISLYLIWQKRYKIAQVKKQSKPFLIIIIILLVTGWGLADLVNINVIRQFMAMLIVIVVVAMLYGYQLFKLISFPLFYLLFSVPFGDFLIPKLQDVTAYISILGLELTGIPVYWEGLFISIPSGDFEVAVACSGIRYLIASLALGTLYAYLTYQKTYKRIIFIILSIIVPIVANGIRAYGIIIIAHLSEMEYATGFDHLIYGWLFFGLIIFILFFIGSRWADEAPNVINNNMENLAIVSYQPNKYLLISIIAVMLMSPLSSYWFDSHVGKINKTIKINSLTISAKIAEKDNRWKPNFAGNDIEIIQTLKQNEDIFSLYIAYYLNQIGNKKLIASTHSIYDLKQYKLRKKQSIEMYLHNKKVVVSEYQLTSPTHNRLVWAWYYVYGESLTSKIKIKILQAFGKITGQAIDSSFIALSIENDDTEYARKALLQFMTDNWSQIKKEIDN